MRQCPNCHASISESAVRCRHCRRPVTSSNSKFFKRFSFGAKLGFAPLGKSSEAFGWMEPLFLCAAFFGVLAWIHWQELGYVWVQWLRTQYSFFTREPLLQTYVYIFVETFALKLGLVLLVVFYLILRRKPVLDSLALKPKLWHFSRNHLILFLVLCAGISWWEGMDPLAPDLPTPLFFAESATLGNVLTIFSLAVVAPITEEVLFRGVIYPGLGKKWGRAVSLLATTALFTAAHAPQMNGAYEHLWVIFAVGLFLSWQRAVTGSTLYVIGLHAFYNSLLVAAGFIRFCFYGF